ncbi:MAG: hypothetical protein KDK07_03705 [Bauldia sp.]|nr:hypothetical protein [Bauldia sp.]
MKIALDATRPGFIQEPQAEVVTAEADDIRKPEELLTPEPQTGDPRCSEFSAAAAANPVVIDESGQGRVDVIGKRHRTIRP